MLYNLTLFLKGYVKTIQHNNEPRIVAKRSATPPTIVYIIDISTFKVLCAYVSFHRNIKVVKTNANTYVCLIPNNFGDSIRTFFDCKIMSIILILKYTDTSETYIKHLSMIEG
jgi:hypothetical protein